MDGADDPDAEADHDPDAGGPAADDGGDDAGSIGLVEARRRAIDAADELLDHEFEGVVRIENRDRGDGGGWRALVEVVERSAVPDTQDIIGRYEISLDDAGELTGYGLVERYRRGEMREEL